MEKFNSRVLEFQDLLNLLFSKNGLTIYDVVKNKLPRFEVEGIYAISTPDDKEVVYVGKTRTKSIIGRLADHRTIGTNSDLKGMLKLFSDYPQTLDEYKVRCIKVDDPKKRAFLENFLISIIQPPFNKQ